MKFDKYVLAELVSIVQSGLMQQTDISDDLRNLELYESKPGVLGLSDDYLAKKGRKNPYTEE